MFCLLDFHSLLLKYLTKLFVIFVVKELVNSALDATNCEQIVGLADLPKMVDFP